MVGAGGGVVVGMAAKALSGPRFGWLGLAAVGIGCASMGSARIPVPQGPVTRSAVHDLTVAILPFEDVRLAREAPDRRGLYLYNGVEYRGTRLEAMGRPMAAFTEAFARHLLHAGVFARLLRAEDPAAAQNADLILTGQVLRARGYVEKQPAEGEAPRVLAEVALRQLRLEDPKSGAVVFDGGTGWAIVERRDETDPWQLLSDALAVAIERWARVLRQSALREAVAEQVHLPNGGLSEAPMAAWVGAAPPGWRFETEDGTVPRGWKGESTCERGVFIQRSALRFHRVLGPYVPRVAVWRCPVQVRLDWDRRSEYPATVAGRDDRGRWVFTSALGGSNWPDAEEELFEALELRPPPRRYIFRLPLGPDPARSGPTGPAPHAPLL